MENRPCRQGNFQNLIIYKMDLMLVKAPDNFKFIFIADQGDHESRQGSVIQKDKWLILPKSPARQKSRKLI
jgi:hypothetical protein